MSRTRLQAVGVVAGCLLLVSTGSAHAQTVVQTTVVAQPVNIQTQGTVTVQPQYVQPQYVQPQGGMMVQPSYGQPPYGQPQYVMTQPGGQMMYVNPNGRMRMVSEPYVGQAVPPGGTITTRPSGALIGVGGGLLGLGWVSGIIGLSASIRCSSGFLTVSCSSWSGWLIIPVVGSWLSLADPQTPPAVGIITGLAQLGGIGMMIGGAVMRLPTLQYPRYGQRTPSVDWTIVPTSGSAAPGISATGVF